MRKTALTATILGIAGALVAAAGLRETKPAASTLPVADAGARVQIALLLDTSNSMDGLIDQARSQLWHVVNDFAVAKKAGRAPAVELALYEYGKATVPAADGYVRRVVPFTADLDRVSEALFSLTTNGGEEYCGRAIAEATRGLEWSPDAGDLKLIFIAGNEPFDQGALDWHDAIRAARARGITVNVVHAGAEEERGWRDAAAFAGGEYVKIDQDRRIVAVAAPQDAEIERLGVELNATYLPYGAGGSEAAERQQAQDANAVAVRQGAPVQRALSKASAAYDNRGWDLVDAAKSGLAVEKLADADLPPALRGLGAAERSAKIAAAAARRQELQSRIQTLDAARRAFVAQAAKAQSARPDTLDAAVTRALRGQAEKMGFRFE